MRLHVPTYHIALRASLAVSWATTLVGKINIQFISWSVFTPAVNVVAACAVRGVHARSSSSRPRHALDQSGRLASSVHRWLPNCDCLLTSSRAARSSATRHHPQVHVIARVFICAVHGPAASRQPAPLVVVASARHVGARLASSARVSSALYILCLTRAIYRVVYVLAIYRSFNVV